MAAFGSALSRIRQWARALGRDVVVLWCAARDPRVPWYAKAMAALVVAYALSPIDLIPDFIPVLGLLDDLVLVPSGILLATWMIPDHVLHELRESANGLARPESRAGLVVVVLIWLAAASIMAWLLVCR